MALSVAVSSGIGAASSSSPLTLCQAASFGTADQLVVLFLRAKNHVQNTIGYDRMGRNFDVPAGLVVAYLSITGLAKTERVFLNVAILAEIGV